MGQEKHTNVFMSPLSLSLSFTHPPPPHTHVHAHTPTHPHTHTHQDVFASPRSTHTHAPKHRVLSTDTSSPPKSGGRVTDDGGCVMGDSGGVRGDDDQRTKLSTISSDDVFVSPQHGEVGVVTPNSSLEEFDAVKSSGRLEHVS